MRCGIESCYGCGRCVCEGCAGGQALDDEDGDELWLCSFCLLAGEEDEDGLFDSYEQHEEEDE